MKDRRISAAVAGLVSASALAVLGLAVGLWRQAIEWRWIVSAHWAIVCLALAALAAGWLIESFKGYHEWAPGPSGAQLSAWAALKWLPVGWMTIAAALYIASAEGWL